MNSNTPDHSRPGPPTQATPSLLRIKKSDLVESVVPTYSNHHVAALPPKAAVSDLRPDRQACHLRAMRGGH